MSDSKKPSTDDILKMVRQKGAADSAPAASSAMPPESAGEATAPEAASTPAAGAKSEAPPAAKPGSTADVLAAIRGGGGAAKKAEAGGGAPQSTADILAAARGGAGGGGGEKPKGTSDILAAVRSKGGGAPSEASAKEAGAPAKPLAAKSPAVSGRDPKELVQALKSAVPAASGSGVQVASSTRKPKLPGALPVKAAAPSVPRRSFVAAFLDAALQPFFLGWAVFSAIGGLSLLLMARFMMPNMVLELPSRFKIGPASDYPPESVSEKFKAARGVWIVRTAAYNGRDMIYALASVCTHLGCTPNWLEGEQKFKCPCHGSGFYITGINFEGPAPRPLERVGISLAPDGMLEVDKSQKFQEELGQWSDTKSYFTA